MRYNTAPPVHGSSATPTLTGGWPTQAAHVQRSIKRLHTAPGPAVSELTSGDVSHRFGIKLRSLRSARNMTQQDMARRFGIDRSFISDLERGRKSVSLVTLEVLALGMGVSISELLANV